ncbi:MAG TPA: glycoside hydrolase family 95 protein, partial [Fimbriimonadaceae bacterium]|nr:glycoside hydrolase family 95 protein [Fimbriimonadaceae bacterium]
MLILPILAAMTLDPSLTVLTNTEARSFVESSPLGNGRLGAMVFGGVAHERVVLNESTMWSGSPQDADRPDAYKVLPEIRKLLLSGENRRAQDLLQGNFICQGAGSGNGSGKSVPYGCYQTFGDLTIDSPQSNPQDYRRVLDLDRAIATVQYEAEGTRFTREAFVSAPADLIVYRFTADKPGRISFTARLSRQERAEVAADGHDLVMSGQLESGNPAIPGVRFAGKLRAILHGGSLSTDAQGIHVQGADEATIIFSAGTNLYDKDYAEHVDEHIDRATRTPFADLEREHVRDYQRFFHRVKLVLPEGSHAQEPTVQRLIAMKKGEIDPSLAALYFNFGRYLLISSSRPDSPLPANLQGIWAEEYQTPWNGDFHIDINVQMNYWPAEVANLAECHEPFFDLIQSQLPPWRAATVAAREFRTADGAPARRGFAIRTSHNIFGGMGWKWDKT